MIHKLNFLLGLAIFSTLVLIASSVSAQDEIKAKMKNDKTGTNPINFTFDARLYNEFQWLNTSGDGEQNITTFEFRAPFLDGKWQFRTKIRYVSVEADINDDGADDIDESGFGDIDFRFLTVPYINMKKRFALAVGLETFLDTASEDELGSGTTSLGPQAFLVFFAPLGLKGMIFAPAYQHKFSIDEDDGRDNVHQGLIDIYLLWTSTDKQYWSLIDPQIILDYEQNVEYMTVDAEFGIMLDKFLGTKGHSAHLRPSIGIGHDRPVDGSLEIGYKVVW